MALLLAGVLLISLVSWGISHLAGGGDDTSIGSGSGGTVGDSDPTSDGADVQAHAMAALIDDSSRSRTAVKDAVIATKQCRSLDANASTFRAAAAARGRQRDAAGGLDTSALPNGATLAATLIRALDDSRRADQAFANWAAGLAGGGCTAGDTATSYFHDGDDASTAATADKKQFVELWNPIAGRYGLSTFVYSDV